MNADKINCPQQAVARFAGLMGLSKRNPGVRLRFTPDSMLAPAPQAGICWRRLENGFETDDQKRRDYEERSENLKARLCERSDDGADRRALRRPRAGRPVSR